MSENFGHGLPSPCDGPPTLAQSFEVVPEVGAVPVVRNCHGEKTARLELAAEPFGQFGHFQRITTGLLPLVELLVTSPPPVDFRIPSA